MKESRFLGGELRLDGSKIVGYAGLFDSVSRDFGGFREVFSPRAFNRTLRGGDVLALADGPVRVLGRQRAGTLRLSPNDKGLFFAIDVPKTQAGCNTITALHRGELAGVVISFHTKRDEWRFEGMPTRYLLDVNLETMSIVTQPAFSNTNAAIRSMRQWTASTRRPGSRPLRSF